MLVEPGQKQVAFDQQFDERCKFDGRLESLTLISCVPNGGLAFSSSLGIHQGSQFSMGAASEIFVDDLAADPSRSFVIQNTAFLSRPTHAFPLPQLVPRRADGFSAPLGHFARRTVRGVIEACVRRIVCLVHRAGYACIQIVNLRSFLFSSLLLVLHFSPQPDY
jgi:hypothetical protein